MLFLILLNQSISIFASPWETYDNVPHATVADCKQDKDIRGSTSQAYPGAGRLEKNRDEMDDIGQTFMTCTTLNLADLS